ncbi:MAG: extracellular solute-binding protein [Chloroflexaceae bacterium]|nr:extracellular solute-binding protein [Chloroflexaceae bacterium]
MLPPGRLQPRRWESHPWHLLSYLPRPPPCALSRLCQQPHPPPHSPSPSPSEAQPLSPTLTLWTSEQGAVLEMVRTLAGEFGMQRGVEVAVVPKDADGLRVDMIAHELAGEPLPDLIWGNQEDLAGLLHDGFLQPVGPASAGGVFVRAAVEGATYAGSLWGQPLTVQDFLLLLFHRPMVAQPPSTTDALITLSRTVEEAEEPGREAAERYGLVAAWDEARWFLVWVNGFGGSITTPDGATPTLTTTQVISSFNLLRELAVAAPPGPQKGRDWFGSGQVALAIDGPWALSGYRSLSPTLDLGIAPLPQVPSTGLMAASAMGGSYLMLGRDVEGELLVRARALARFLVLPDVQVRLALASGRLPALRSALKAPAITSDPVLGPAVLQAETASGLPPTPALRCVFQGINAFLPRLLEGETSHEEVAAAMQHEAERCLGEEP